MQLGATVFRLVVAWFAPVVSGEDGPGWDFLFYGHCAADADAGAYPLGVAVVAAGAPIPLARADDYTGTTLRMTQACYPDSGQSWFGLWVDGEDETWEPELRFGERLGSRYQVEFTSGTSVLIGGAHQPLWLSAWVEIRPERVSSELTLLGGTWGRWPRPRAEPGDAPAPPP